MNIPVFSIFLSWNTVVFVTKRWKTNFVVLSYFWVSSHLQVATNRYTNQYRIVLLFVGFGWLVLYPSDLPCLLSRRVRSRLLLLVLHVLLKFHLVLLSKILLKFLLLFLPLIGSTLTKLSGISFCLISRFHWFLSWQIASFNFTFRIKNISLAQFFGNPFSKGSESHTHKEALEWF